MREHINQYKKIGIVFLSVVSLLGLGNQSIAAQSQDFGNHLVLIHLDKTDTYIGDYGTVVTNVDTGEQIGNVYTDGGSEYIDIPGFMSVDNGQTLEACAVTLDYGEAVCDTQIAYGDETEFNIDMAYRQPLQDILGHVDEFHSSSEYGQDFNDVEYLDTSLEM